MSQAGLFGLSAAFLRLAQQPDELDRLIQNMGVVALPIWAATAVAMSVAPLAVAFLGWRRTPAGGTTDDPARLPLPLRTARVLGRSYEVADTSGVVLEEKTWTETNVSVSSTPSSVSVHGDQVLHTPGQIHTTTTTTRKARLWVRNLDGKEEPWELTDAGFETRPGHIVTLLWRPTGNGKWDGLMAYNHISGSLSTFGDAGLNRAHAIAKFPSWLLTTAVGTGGGMLGFVAAARSVTGTGVPDGWLPPSTLLTVAVIAGLLALVPLGLTALILRPARTWRFRSLLLPAYRRWFERATPELTRRLAGEGRPPMR